MKNENRETCKYIADTIEMYTNGDGYKCPHCEQVHNIIEYEDSEHENENGETCYTCPNCGGEIVENELEAVSIYDYFDGDIFDIEYRVDSNKEYRSVRVMIACGGPNIYIDTKQRAVVLHWWSEYADYMLTSSACDEIDAFFEELFNC